MANKKILLVDDSETVRKRIRMSLEGKPYDILEGIDGLDALNQITENPDIDLVITDINMPRLDGIKMCEKIQEQNMLRPGTPILALTTEMSSNLKKIGKSFGIVAWIIKPLDHNQTVTFVEKMLEFGESNKKASGKAS